jgi:hypothetical protein
MIAVILAAVLYLSFLWLCGRLTARYAAQRGRSQIVWFALGALFYPLPYIVLALLRPKEPDDWRGSAQPRPTTSLRDRNMPASDRRMAVTAVA